jgi:hypothetical protein
MAFTEHPDVPSGCFLGVGALGSPNNPVIFGASPDEWVEVKDELTDDTLDTAVQRVIDGDVRRYVGDAASVLAEVQADPILGTDQSDAPRETI